MTKNVSVAMGQIDPVVGDIVGNVDRMLSAVNQAQEQNADLIVFPEMSMTGYPPEDLLLRHDLYRQVNAGLDRLSQAVQGIACVVGYPMMDELGERFNMAAWIENGIIQASYIKQNLPNYSVFDERRYFQTGNQPCVIDFKGIRFGLLICEDIWKVTPSTQAKEAGAQVILNLNASPFSEEKHMDRMATLKRRVDEIKCPIIYVNQVGAQDDLVFDGGSFAIDANAQVKVQAPEFVPSLSLVSITPAHNSTQPVAVSEGEQAPLFRNEARTYEALKLGIRDYVQKNGFPGVLLGLSGGIDSALTLAVAVDALGPEKVEAVMMPFRYTADISKEDAAKQAQLMGVHYQSISIEPMYNAFSEALTESLGFTEPGLTEENLQARIRANLLMALSNKSEKMVLATSNKSEVAVGYSTIYGDMAGGYSPLKDVPKTLVYKLAQYRNSISNCIPERVITRAPSAELRPDQRDQDSLPDYSVLDEIIYGYVTLDETPVQIASKGFAKDEVDRVVGMINRNEYKRRQSAPGTRITPRAFGRDRRYPITNRYSE